MALGAVATGNINAYEQVMTDDRTRIKYIMINIYFWSSLKEKLVYHVLIKDQSLTYLICFKLPK